MLGRVQIEHELPERALEPREATLQHHEACAGELGGGLKVHLAKTLAEIEMLLRRKAIMAFRPEAMVLDVALGSSPSGTSGAGSGRLGICASAASSSSESFFSSVSSAGISARDLGHERLRRRFLVAFFRGPAAWQDAESLTGKALRYRVAELHPQLVTFNGSSFDLPVLRYRAMTPQRGSAKTGLDTA